MLCVFICGVVVVVVGIVFVVKRVMSIYIYVFILVVLW